MGETAKAVVIGGGIIGTSVLCHLAKRGWRDVILLEKSVLTAGSTWHAAANGNTVNALPNMARLQRRSIAIYEAIEQETGQSLSIHRPGGFFLAANADRFKEYQTLMSRGRRLGLSWQLLSPEEIAQKHPLTVTEGVLGALYDPLDGHIDPYGATEAFAKSARALGAQIREHCAVTELYQERNGTWRVVTENGDIAADWIVNAAGLWADEVAAMAGARLPMVRMEHHYLITEDIPEIAQRQTEMPIIRDGDSSFYMRQEGRGLLLGVYEQQATPWALDGVPKDFGQELLPDDLDRLMPNLEQAFERFPVLTGTGIKRAVNGPFVFSPDGLPLIGPVPGQRNHFAAAGFLAGLNMGGGFGEVIAEWIVTGRTALDLASCDVARFGNWAIGDYMVERAKDTYAHRYQLHYPHEERDAGRPARSFPLYDTHKALGAVFGPVNGWERPLWYARAQDKQHDIYGFERQNWFEATCEEARHVRSAVGLMDASAFAKYLVEGAGAGAYLDRMVANTLPKREGRCRLVHMCDETGGIVAEFTATRLDSDRFMLVGASAAEQIHLRWMKRHLNGKAVSVRSITAERGVVAVAGPLSRQLLARVTNADLSNGSFPYLSAREIDIAGLRCLALRVSFVGELGWELYCNTEDLCALWQALFEAGADLGVRPYGGRALDWLRLEKAYPRYGSEINTEVTPYEVGLDWAVKLDKGHFLGREALQHAKDTGIPRYHLRLLEVEDGSTDPVGQEAILDGGDQVAGYVTSGGFGPNAAKTLAMALMRPGFENPGTGLRIDIVGELRSARILERAPIDPEGQRLKS